MKFLVPFLALLPSIALGIEYEWTKPIDLNFPVTIIESGAYEDGGTEFYKLLDSENAIFKIYVDRRLLDENENYSEFWLYFYPEKKGSKEISWGSKDEIIILNLLEQIHREKRINTRLPDLVHSRLGKTIEEVHERLKTINMIGEEAYKKSLKSSYPAFEIQHDYPDLTPPT